MTLTQQAFEALLADADKRVVGDIEWHRDEDHSPARVFRADVVSQHGYPLFVNGRWNPKAGTLSYALIHRGVGRVYGLDLGAEHHNPDCKLVGETHEHRWTEAFRDKVATGLAGKTVAWDRPSEAWTRFCSESAITHRGRMHAPLVQRELSP